MSLQASLQGWDGWESQITPGSHFLIALHCIRTKWLECKSRGCLLALAWGQGPLGSAQCGVFIGSALGTKTQSYGSLPSAKVSGEVVKATPWPPRLTLSWVALRPCAVSSAHKAHVRLVGMPAKKEPVPSGHKSLPTAGATPEAPICEQWPAGRSLCALSGAGSQVLALALGRNLKFSFPPSYPLPGVLLCGLLKGREGVVDLAKEGRKTIYMYRHRDRSCGAPASTGFYYGGSCSGLQVTVTRLNSFLLLRGLSLHAVVSGNGGGVTHASLFFLPSSDVLLSYENHVLGLAPGFSCSFDVHKWGSWPLACLSHHLVPPCSQFFKKIQ